MLISEREGAISFTDLEKYAMDKVARQNHYYEEIAFYNTHRVVDAFRSNMVSDYYLKPTTGYAYGDVGRDKLDEIFADIFHAEAALVRPQFVSGTHALAVAMLGNLRPGDEVIAATGTPYDTMQTIIGIPHAERGSLIDLGIHYKEIKMRGNRINIRAVREAMTERTRMIHIQRSCGYSNVRETLDVASIGALIKSIKRARPDVICFVDNCYGEFTEKIEPTDVGADLMAGSLIKNLGGGLAPTGGYIVGDKRLVYNAACRLTVPGLAGEMGATLGDTARGIYQGLFLAPHVVMQAVKTAIFAAAIFERLGYDVKPASDILRHDIIQCITLGTPEKLKKFCQAVQANSPVDAHVVPVPGELPGYADPIIMAAGTFVQGASIELSCDGPMREPYNVYLQGGLTYEHGMLAMMEAARILGKAGENHGIYTPI